MDEIRYLFIDGAYAREIYNDAMDEVFGEHGELQPGNIAAQVSTIRPFRTFFYDCVDDTQRQNEAESDFRARIKRQEQYFDKIKSARAVHLRLGTLTGRKRRQKEVDVLLAVDMLTHGFNRNMTHATLLAGDLDFRPIVEALVRAGIFVEVWNENKSASQELGWAADAAMRVGWHQMYSWGDSTFNSSHTLPRSIGPSDGAVIGAQVVKKGVSSGCPVTVFRRIGSPTAILKAELSNGVSWFEHENEQVLQRYFSATRVPVDWANK